MKPTVRSVPQDVAVAHAACEAGRVADQASRSRILEDLDTTLLVEASAGTGKTTSMVGRMVALVREGCSQIDTMAAVTFTRKAAAELRSRFQIRLEQAAAAARGEHRRRLQRGLREVERCFIGTIHSFCARLLRERPVEAGVDIQFQELDQRQDEALCQSAWADYVADLFVRDSPVLRELRELGLEMDELRTAYTTFVKYPDVPQWPAESAALGDLTQAVAQLEAYVDHMRRVSLEFPAERGNDKLMSAYERIVRFRDHRDLGRPAELMEVLEEFKASTKIVQKVWPGGAKQGKQEKERWDGFLGQVAQPLLKRWRAKRYPVVLGILQEAALFYERLRRDSGRLNYQDLLIKASRLLAGNPEIRRYFRGRFTHLLVDEFQDTDPVQAEVMLYLTASEPGQSDWRACRPVPGSLFVVGDPKQSIYRFRRADIVTYDQVKQIIRNSGGDVVPLTANFRTVKPLVDWTNHVFNEEFMEAAGRYGPPASRMETGRQGSAEGQLAGMRFIEVPGGSDEEHSVADRDAARIAAFIHSAIDSGLTVPRSEEDLRAGRSGRAEPRDFLIITRNKKELAIYGRKLQELAVPHAVSGGSALDQVSELRLLLDCLVAVAEPENPLSLVSVLRGGLFGLSDAELYDYRRAGGAFCYRRKLPQDLNAKLRSAVEDAFSRLKTYDRWLKRMPVVPAIERMAADLGLIASALARPGGNVLAGSMAKAFELLRAAGDEVHSPSDAARRLREMIEGGEEFDALPARADDGNVVRVMNLHKAKGLEAPVVFLANPSGHWDPDPQIHVRRDGAQSCGFTAVHAASTGWHAPLLACPADWETHAEEEKRFMQAESIRLLYVAATRAGTLMVITRRSKQKHRSPWQCFDKYIESPSQHPLPRFGGEGRVRGSSGCGIGSEIWSELEHNDAPPRAPAEPAPPLDARDAARAQEAMDARWRAVLQPTYAMVAAKELIHAVRPRPSDPRSGEHGTEWGSVIHTLLETAMRQPDADLEGLARAVLEEQGLDVSRATEAVETVVSVQASDIWRRAQRAEQVLVEVPFALWLEGDAAVSALGKATAADSLPTYLRGVIDLVFCEAGAWVVVDYKTDHVPADGLPALVRHYEKQVLAYARSWQQMIGEPVKEAGLYFVRPSLFQPLEWAR